MHLVLLKPFSGRLSPACLGYWLELVCLMPKPLRRYEILVPLLYNNGRAVPKSLLAKTFADLDNKFGSTSWETQTVHGSWTNKGTVHKDNLIRFFVDVPDLPTHRTFFRAFKEVLKQRFKQSDVWIISHTVDVI